MAAGWSMASVECVGLWRIIWIKIEFWWKRQDERLTEYNSQLVTENEKNSELYVNVHLHSPQIHSDILNYNK